jgi:hypothetical protein
MVVYEQVVWFVCTRAAGGVRRVGRERESREREREREREVGRGQGWVL